MNLVFSQVACYWCILKVLYISWEFSCMNCYHKQALLESQSL